MKKSKLFYLFPLVVLPLSSCMQEATDSEALDDTVKVPVAFIAEGEDDGDADADASKVTLDFSKAQNVRWQDGDKVAVFDGTAKREFSIKAGTNTGATAVFEGEVASGYSSLLTVYPYSAGNSRSGSSLSVTVPSVQTVSGMLSADPAALVSVGLVSEGTVVFKQVCGLLKFQVSDNDIIKVILRGTKLAGTVTVASSTGVVSTVGSTSDNIEINCSGGTFEPGTYYAAVLPGTTTACNFTVDYIASDGLTRTRTTTKDLTIIRKQGRSIGSVDDSWSTTRHIFNKDQLWAWGAVMCDEDDIPVYLDADVDCASDPWPFATGDFKSVFDGQGHKLYNLVVESESQTGFIYTLSGTLKNLVIGSSDGASWDNTSRITHTGTAGDIEYVAPVCRLSGRGIIYNVTNFAKVEVPSSSTSRAYIGGLVGLVPNTAIGVSISNSKNYGSVISGSSWGGAPTRMGGILGQGSGAIVASGLENHGTLTIANNVTNFIGGLCGDLSIGSTVSGSKNYGSIVFADSGTQTTYLGGCFGSVRGSAISDCHNYAVITATRNADHWMGGIAGFMESGKSSLTDCVNHEGADLAAAPSVTSKRVRFGGIAGGCQYGGEGEYGITIQDCRNEACITNNGGGTHFGGIAGLFETTSSTAHTVRLSYCENTGAVASTVTDGQMSLGQELRVGGIIGMADTEVGAGTEIIESCVNKGPVSVSGALKTGASLRIGGIVGHSYMDVRVDKCMNFASVSFDHTGADVGNATFTMGGIMGYVNKRTSTRYQRVTDCINTGTISSIRNYSTQYMGGIIGGGTNADAYPQIDGCKNYGTVTATRTVNTILGGVCGYTCFNVSNCSDFGDVSGGQWHGALVGDGNSKAVTNIGNKVGNGVKINNDAVPVSNGTYSYNSGSDLEQRHWFCGWMGDDGVAFTVSVVDQESYSGGTDPEETGPSGYLFLHTGSADDDPSTYYRMFYAISTDGLNWTEINGGDSPMPTYWGFPYATKADDGYFYLVGVSNAVPRNPVVWKSEDMVSWTLVKNIPRSVMNLPEGYGNDNNSFGAVKIFFDPVTSQFILTWHAGESAKSGDAWWESMRIFYTLTSDFETFTPAQKLFNFTGAEANTAQIDCSIKYYAGRYYALFKDERSKSSSASYYKRPRMAVATSLTGPYTNPGGALTDKHREAPSVVQSPDGNYWYLYVEYYDDHVYEVYRSTQLTDSGWTKLRTFTPASMTVGECRHGCVVPIDAKVYRRLKTAYGN